MSRASAPQVTVIVSERRNHIWPRIESWCEDKGHRLVSSAKEANGGDLLLLVSCTEKIPSEVRSKYARVLVIHESALPKGRGWSPFAWQILEGANEITISLLEAAEEIDAGDILRQVTVQFDGTELSDELNTIRDQARIGLAQWAVENFEDAKGVKQKGEPTFYKRRYPRDSKIDVNRPLAEQFELLRIVEPRFPAYFEMRGCFYELSVRKVT